MLPVIIKGWSTSMPDILQVRVGHRYSDNHDAAKGAVYPEDTEEIIGSAIRITDHVTCATAEVEIPEEFDDHIPIIAMDYDKGNPPRPLQVYVHLMPRDEYQRYFGKRKSR